MQTDFQACTLYFTIPICEVGQNSGPRCGLLVSLSLFFLPIPASKTNVRLSISAPGKTGSRNLNVSAKLCPCRELNLLFSGAFLLLLPLFSTYSYRSFLLLVTLLARHFRAILTIEIMIKITATVFNFFCSASLSRGSGPLEMRKVEMGNGIGCITPEGGGEKEGERENVAKTGDRAGWLSLLSTPLFRSSRLYSTLPPLMSQHRRRE